MRKWLYSLFEWTICFIMNNISSVRVGKGPIIKFLYQNEDVVCTGGPHKLWFSSQTDTLTDRCSSLRGFKVSLSLSRALDLHTCFFFPFRQSRWTFKRSYCSVAHWMCCSAVSDQLQWSHQAQVLTWTFASNHVCFLLYYIFVPLPSFCAVSDYSANRNRSQSVLPVIGFTLHHISELA